VAAAATAVGQVAVEIRSRLWRRRGNSVEAAPAAVAAAPQPNRGRLLVLPSKKRVVHRPNHRQPPLPARRKPRLLLLRHQLALQRKPQNHRRKKAVRKRRSLHRRRPRRKAVRRRWNHHLHHPPRRNHVRHRHRRRRKKLVRRRNPLRKNARNWTCWNRRQKSAVPPNTSTPTRDREKKSRNAKRELATRRNVVIWANKRRQKTTFPILRPPGVWCSSSKIDSTTTPRNDRWGTQRNGENK